MVAFCNRKRKAITKFSDMRKPSGWRILQLLGDMTSCIFYLQERNKMRDNRTGKKNIRTLDNILECIEK